MSGGGASADSCDSVESVKCVVSSDSRENEEVVECDASTDSRESGG